MKKNLIYTVAFLLCGAFFFTSCQDMLNVDSNRVEYEYDGWSATDSVYSVLGILKSVQGVADRQILLNELRGDLLTLNETKAVLDVQDIFNFNYTNEENKYLDVKDYYTIINNCNVFLSRVDTTIMKNGLSVMLPEYVAVKSIRAWTYLQLAVNYNNIPFFTKPITTHSGAEDVMNAPKLSRDEVIDRLIADIAPYENPSKYTMPVWGNNSEILPLPFKLSKVDEDGKKTEIEAKVVTKHLFVPVRMLLGEMYLWKKDYKKAARCFYNQITGDGTNNTARKYSDNRNVVKYSSEKGKNYSNNYTSLFITGNYESGNSSDDYNKNKMFTIIPFSESDNMGTVSGLADIFSPKEDISAAQVFASPALQSLSRLQKYRYIQGDPDKPSKVEYGDNYEYPGDLRIKATTGSYMHKEGFVDMTDNNIVIKFNLSGFPGDMFAENNLSPGYLMTSTPYVMLLRIEHAYLRFAEALAGLGREGYEGANELAMAVLKEGVKDKYDIYKGLVTGMRDVLDEDGNVKMVLKKDENGAVLKDEDGNDIKEPLQEKYVVSFIDSTSYDFTDSYFANNIGIHSRGSGDAEHNEFYALDTLCVARYIGCIDDASGKEVVTRKMTADDFNNYIADLILDELALELSWEGIRFSDLVRFSEALDDVDVLAKRIAGRNYVNKVKYRHPSYEIDTDLYNRLIAKDCWYLPLPAVELDNTGK